MAWLLLSCTDGLVPGAGTYVLTALDGTPAPFILTDDLFAAGDRVVVEQTADSVTLQSRSRLVRSQGFRTLFYAADGTLVDSTKAFWSGTASFTVKGVVAPRRLIITYDDIVSMPPETLEVRAEDRLIGRRIVAGWCESGPPQECPTPPHLREFDYRLR
jgi:hypothetical protein